MFTGLYPHAHGSETNGRRLAPGQVTLAQILKDAGFRTAGFVGGLTMNRESCGLERGFEVYEDSFDTYKRDGSIGSKLAASWLDALSQAERYFLFLHLYDAHGPYRRDGSSALFFESTDPGPELSRIPGYQQLSRPNGTPATGLSFYVDSYDTMIRYADEQLGRILDEVDLSETVVVVTADHGETLAERLHILDHGGQVYDEQIRIPLVIHVPGADARRSSASVETVDLLPTLLELLQVPLPEGRPTQGLSLVPQLRGATSEVRELTFSSARAVSARYADRAYVLDPKRRIFAARSAQWKLVRFPGIPKDYVELYDLKADPGERINVAPWLPDVREAYLKAIKNWATDRGDTGPSPDLPEEIAEKLRHLGYIDD
jgi:arylsulfatase A-like enzyme